MTSRALHRRPILRPGPLRDYLQVPLKYLIQFSRTAVGFAKGDPHLLVKNPRYLNPPLYLAACVALSLALLQSVWPDDPIKTFENPSYFRPLEPFLKLVPLPLFAVAAIYILAINLPMLIVSTALRYNVRIPRIVAASSYAFGSIFLLSVILLLAKLVTVPIFGAYDVGLASWIWTAIGTLTLGLLTIRNFKLLGIAHGMNGYKFALLNFAVSGVPLILVELAAGPTSSLRSVTTALYHPVKTYSVPSGSMAPTLPTGTAVLVNQLLPVAQIRVGDVVLFYRSHDLTTPWVKRIVGRGGDRIQMKDGVLQINQKPVARERIDDLLADDPCGSYTKVLTKRWKETLPNGVSFETFDCVEDGYMDNTQTYTVPERHFFMLGDNRDNSTDSRFLNEVGYISEQNIIGKAYFVLYPLGRGHLYKSK